MNKEELTEFIKLFKEETAPIKEEEKGEDVEPKAKDEKNLKKKKKKSQWQSVEDKLFTLLILIAMLLYLYLVVTGQSFILDREIKKFNESQDLLLDYLSKFTTSSAKQTRQSKEEKFKYDQYAARKEFQLNWKLVGESNNFLCFGENCEKSDDEREKLKQTVELIHKQYKVIEDYENTEVNKVISPVKVITVKGKLSNFSQFKNVFKPKPLKSTLSDKQLSLLKNLDTIYAHQIRSHFKTQLLNIHTSLFRDGASLFSAKQQVLFLKKLDKKLKKMQNHIPKQLLNKYDALAAKTRTFLHQKETAIAKFDADLKTTIDEVNVAIGTVPICPKTTDEDYEHDEIKDKQPDAYFTFFNTLYQ